VASGLLICSSFGKDVGATAVAGNVVSYQLVTCGEGPRAGISSNKGLRRFPGYSTGAKGDAVYLEVTEAGQLGVVIRAEHLGAQ